MENVKSIKSKKVIGIHAIKIANLVFLFDVVLIEYDDGETIIDLEPQ